MGYCLITGATGVLGRIFAKKLIENNDLVITGRNEDKLKELSTELKSNNRDVIYFSLDLSLSSDREAFYSFLEEKGIKVSTLIYVAGQDLQKAFIKYSEREIINQCRVTYEGALSVTNWVLKNREEDLKILVVSSITGYIPMPYFAEYSSLKGALISFFKALKSEETKAKITILTPSSILTREDVIEDIKRQGFQGKMAAKSPEYVVEKGLKALDKNKTICIPGLYNKLVIFFNNITPYCIKKSIVKKKFKNKEKNYYGDR